MPSILVVALVFVTCWLGSKEPRVAVNSTLAPETGAPPTSSSKALTAVELSPFATKVKVPEVTVIEPMSV